MPSYQIQLEQFTGPLDLLLHLIRQDEMDIFDLDLARIIEQYLGVIESEGVHDLPGAYHFLAMAATLVELKSRMLLPREEGSGEASEEEEALDPRAELAHKLAAYQDIKDVTEDLEQRYLQTGRHWPRSAIEQLEAEIVYTMDSLSIYDLMTTFAEVLEKPRFKQITIFKEDYDLEEARRWLKARLKGGPALLAPLLIEQSDVLALILTFVALLDLIKEEEVAFEKHEDGTISISLAAISDVL